MQGRWRLMGKLDSLVVYGGVWSHVGGGGGREGERRLSALVSILSRSRERARKKRGGGALAMGGMIGMGGMKSRGVGRREGGEAAKCLG